MTAGHDEIRAADRLITCRARGRIEEDGLISIEISPIEIIAHLAPCQLIDPAKERRNLCCSYALMTSPVLHRYRP